MGLAGALQGSRRPHISCRRGRILSSRDWRKSSSPTDLLRVTPGAGSALRARRDVRCRTRGIRRRRRGRPEERAAAEARPRIAV